MNILNYQSIPVLCDPKDYDKVLTISYGANYMTPIHDEANDDLHVHFREAFLKHLKLI